MKFNKIVALALALVMVFALCACGGGTDTKKDDSNSTAKVDTNTVSVGAIVIARDDVPTDEIYAFVSTIFDNLDAITAQHAKGAELSIEAAASVKGVPYHPGAAKYFEEKGVKVDAVKEGAGNGTASALNFGTGGQSGTYYGFGGVLASYVSANSGCKVTPLTSGGSQANVEDLASGNVQIAFVQSDVMNYAYNGQRLFDSPVTGFSVVAQLYQEQVQIVTTNPDIKTVADLAGKKVSIGAAGSGVYFNAVDVLGAYDLKESDISAVYQSFGDSAESLRTARSTPRSSSPVRPPRPSPTSPLPAVSTSSASTIAMCSPCSRPPRTTPPPPSRPAPIDARPGDAPHPVNIRYGVSTPDAVVFPSQPERRFPPYV